MILLDSDEMRAADKHAIDCIGIPAAVLMENAAVKSIFAMESLLSDLNSLRFTIVCGRGNNGGDGLAIARHLHNRGLFCSVFLIDAPRSPEAALNYEILKKSGVTPLLLSDSRVLDKLQVALEFSDVAIDCIFGAGFNGEITGITAEAVGLINQAPVKVVSIDMPSGVCASTGKVAAASIQADYTLALAALKPGQFLLPGLSNCGRVVPVDIGIPQVSIAASAAKTMLVTQELCVDLLHDRPCDMHKGSAGKICLIAGSAKYQGAAVLSSYGALRSGAGITRLMLPQCLKGNLHCQLLPEVIVDYLPSCDNYFDFAGCLAPDYFQEFSAIVAGPGWGRSEKAAASLKCILDSYDGRLILDADAIALLDVKWLENTRAEVVLTPHPGEMSALCGLPKPEICASPVECAKNFSQAHNVTVVLKSAVTIIAESKGGVYISSHPNSGLARGGTGDLLAGLMGGLTALSSSALWGAVCAVHVLSAAAERAAVELGEDGMTISETAAMLPFAIKKIRLEKKKKSNGKNPGHSA